MSSDTPTSRPPDPPPQEQPHPPHDGRLLLLAWESLLQRLAGLLLRHPQQAGFVSEMTRRAQHLRLGQELACARELEADYVAHLSARGITESWYDPAADEAGLLDRHYRELNEAVDSPQPPER